MSSVSQYLRRRYHKSWREEAELPWETVKFTMEDALSVGITLDKNGGIPEALASTLIGTWNRKMGTRGYSYRRIKAVSLI